jgi:hypothetical protein
MVGNDSVVCSVSISRDGTRVATATADGNV